MLFAHRRLPSTHTREQPLGCPHNIAKISASSGWRLGESLVILSECDISACAKTVAHNHADLCQRRRRMTRRIRRNSAAHMAMRYTHNSMSLSLLGTANPIVPHLPVAHSAKRAPPLQLPQLLAVPLRDGPEKATASKSGAGNFAKSARCHLTPKHSASQARR